MGADDREVHVEQFDPMAIYGELAVRTIEEPDHAGVSLETMFDHHGLYVTLRDKYGSSRLVRLVVAPDLPPSDVQDAPLLGVHDAPRSGAPASNPVAALANWLRR